MSALIEGYSYDIFISYRQNDNKYDGWVTRFVTDLKKELEATVKDRLNVFFDENPEDGLLETHSVDKSIADKLKCLIFIPVISQTYCDPKSYAWNYEFRVFNRSLDEDPLGRNVRLSNDNVAGRVLPVRIHELDPEDEDAIEAELGEKLRSIDFIYRSAGVNRPLRPDEDHPGNNYYKISYRDQINKVANAVKDILNALKKKNLSPQDSAVEHLKSYAPSKPGTSRLKKLVLAGTFITIILAGTAIFWFTGRGKSSGQQAKSIAVLPFRNDSPSDSNTYFINGIMEEVLNNLQKIEDVRIISRTSVEQYRDSPKTIPQIGRELGVNYIVEGSGQRYGNSFRVNVKLIRAKRETNLWGRQYEQLIRKPEDIVNVQTTIAQSIVSELKGTITPDEKMLMEKIPTSDLKAYDHYQKGRDALAGFWIDVNNTELLFRAEQHFKNALNTDPKFAHAILGQAEVLWNYKIYLNRQNVLDSVLMLTEIALSYDDKIAEAFLLKGWCYEDSGQSDRALVEFNKAIDLNPNNWKAYYSLADLYDFADPVKSLEYLRKAEFLTYGSAEIPTLLRHMGGQLLITGHIDKASDYFYKAFEIDGDSAIYYSCLGGIEHNVGNFEKAIEFYARALRHKHSYTEVLHNLAVFNQFLGRNVESLKYYRELESRNAMNFNMHRMGYSLIVNGQNNEGNEYLRRHIGQCDEVISRGGRPDLLAFSYYDLAGVYAFMGDRENAYENLKNFAKGKNSFLFLVTMLKHDPLFNKIRNESEFRDIVRKTEERYARVHADAGAWIAKQENF